MRECAVAAVLAMERAGAASLLSWLGDDDDQVRGVTLEGMLAVSWPHAFS